AFAEQPSRSGPSFAGGVIKQTFRRFRILRSRRRRDHGPNEPSRHACRGGSPAPTSHGLLSRTNESDDTKCSGNEKEELPKIYAARFVVNASVRCGRRSFQSKRSTVRPRRTPGSSTAR